VKETIARYCEHLLGPQNARIFGATIANARGMLKKIVLNQTQFTRQRQISEKLQPFSRFSEDFRASKSGREQCRCHGGDECAGVAGRCRVRRTLTNMTARQRGPIKHSDVHSGKTSTALTRNRTCYREPEGIYATIKTRPSTLKSCVQSREHNR